MSELLITQPDREAAAALVEWQNGTGWEPQFFNPGLPKGMREGAWDNHPVVQAFAAHRLYAKELAMSDQARREADIEAMARAIVAEFRRNSPLAAADLDMDLDAWMPEAAAAYAIVSKRENALVEDALECARQRAIALFQAYARGVASAHGRSEQQFMYDVKAFSSELADALRSPISTRATLSGASE